MMNCKIPHTESRHESGEEGRVKILGEALHELQNNLQSIGMGLDLLQLTHADTPECRTISLGIERASRLLREVQEYFFPPEPCFSTGSLTVVIAEVVRKVTQEEEAAGRSVRVVCPESLPMVRLEWQHLGKALERIVRCACALLPVEGGDVVVGAEVREEQPPGEVEVRVQICGAGTLEVEQEKIFTPFWRVNGYQTGLSLVLARQLAHRQHGQLTFEKTSHNQAYFTMRLRIHQGR
jgi:nitrogen-specific signal transduction histidine kinase